MVNISDLITVIAPIYNRATYLYETMESVLNQTHENLEILLVDDGSLDESLSICKYYERLDSRVKVFTQRNGGICSAMKNAVLQAKGDYIARCDSDDINELDRYEKQLKLLKSKDYDLVGCYIKCFGNGDDFNKVYLEKCVNKPIKTYEEQKERLLLGQPITGSTIFAKRSTLLELLPFKKEYSIIEDFYLSVLFHINGKKISILEEKKVNYRVHEDNLSLSGNNTLSNRHTEVAFQYMFKEHILKNKNIIIFRREDEKETIQNVINKHYSPQAYKFKIITEYDLKDFIHKYTDIILDYENTVIFYGISFRDFVIPLANSGKYILFKNLFLSGH